MLVTISQATRDLLTPKWNEYIPHVPTVKQHAALLLDDYPELFYGGAAGGGKSDYLLMAALQYVDVPGYAALIVRRSFAQLSKAGGLLDRAQEWLSGTRARGAETIGGTPTRWDFPGGARLEFGHCQHDKDRHDYQSAQYQFLGVDELTQFSLRVYLYLRSRLRRLAGSKIPTRSRTASNPGNEGHDWVKARFVAEQGDGERKRVYLPAKLSDNPHLDGDEYAATLSELHPYDRKQLLDGDWDVRPDGGRFKREWFAFVDEMPLGMQLVRRWDLAATEPAKGKDPDWTVGALMGKSNNGGPRFVVADIRRFQKTPKGIDEQLAQAANQDGREVKIRYEQEGGSAGKIATRHFRTLLEGFDFNGIPSTGSKVVRSNAFASAAEGGEVALVRAPWNETYLRELETFTGNDKDCPHDDQVDASSGAHTDLTNNAGPSPSDLYGGAVAEEAGAVQ